jgi:lipopolysaccharide export system protein LptA
MNKNVYIKGVIFLFCLSLPVEAKEGEPPGILKMLMGEDKDEGPITIESDQAQFDKKAGVMVYSGNVVVRRGNLRIDSNYLKGFLDEQQNEINRMVAEGKVKVVKEDKTIEAEKATYYRDSGDKERLELEGEPVVYMQKNSLRADKMIFYIINDRYEAKGNVRTVFYRGSLESSPFPADKSQANTLPITITSQDANYNSQTNTAKFLRNVKVNRDDAELSAQDLEVFLEKELNKIEKIVASDNVKIVQKDKEISADMGTFYEKDKKIVLTGNPVSRQGENVLSGRKIVYYLDSETVEVKKARTILHPRNTKEKPFFSVAPGM